MKSKEDQIWDDIAILQGLCTASRFRCDELSVKYKEMARARIAELMDELRQLQE